MCHLPHFAVPRYSHDTMPMLRPFIFSPGCYFKISAGFTGSAAADFENKVVML
jgi:hypothetical protein